LIFFERNSQDLMGQVFSGPRICFVLGDKIWDLDCNGKAFDRDKDNMFLINLGHHGMICWMITHCCIVCLVAVEIEKEGSGKRDGGAS
jgi:hypothetical protein